VSSVASTPPSATPFISGVARRRLVRRNFWGLSIYGVLIVLFIIEKSIHPGLNAFDIQTLVIETMPLALAAMAQASVVLIGGVDLSIGTMMALVNVVAARWMVNADAKQAVFDSVVIILGTVVIGALTGLIITVSRVPDIIVTLATSFVWYGLALYILPTPGGGIPFDFSNLVNGQVWGWLPEGVLVLLCTVVLIWLPWRHSRLGLSVYALGSDRTAAFLSGVNIARTRIAAYALGGLFVGLAGIALLAETSQGDPNSASSFTLNSVACVVLGGVSLMGGRGGLMGPIAAAFVLNLITSILGFLRVDPSYAIVIQGTIVVLVVLFAGGLALRRRR
jgi:ribose transport system permease protein